MHINSYGPFIYFHLRNIKYIWVNLSLELSRKYLVHLAKRKPTSQIYFGGSRQRRKMFYKTKYSEHFTRKKKSGANSEFKLIRISLPGRLHVYQTSMFLSKNRFKITLKCQGLLLVFFNAAEPSLMRIH